MDSPPDGGPDIDDLVRMGGYSDTANIIYIYAPAIYGVETVREELKETLQYHFPSIYVVEDDEDQVDVIKVYYYEDESVVDEEEVLDVVKGFDRSAHITSS